MVQMLSPLGLQEIPVQVVAGLRSLSQFLPQHLTNTLSNYDRMLQAKLKPAQAFCNLLDRLIRANETGLNAGKILIDPIETRKMREDWSRFVDPKAIVMREVPCGSKEAQRILGEDVIQLLSIDEFNNDIFDMDIKSEGSQGAKQGIIPGERGINNVFAFGKDGVSLEQRDSDDGAFSKSEVIVLKWAQYLSSLPWRFPNVPARLFLLCMSALLTASLREISMNGGEGFGAWWVVRCWIDEWMGWSAEMGGFLAVNLDQVPKHFEKAGNQSEAKSGSSEQESGNANFSSNGIQSDMASTAAGQGGIGNSENVTTRDTFGEDLGFEALVGSTNTESLLASQESTRLVFPDRRVESNSEKLKHSTDSVQFSEAAAHDQSNYEFVETNPEDSSKTVNNQDVLSQSEDLDGMESLLQSGREGKEAGDPVIGVSHAENSNNKHDNNSASPPISSQKLSSSSRVNDDDTNTNRKESNNHEDSTEGEAVSGKDQSSNGEVKGHQPRAVIPRAISVTSFTAVEPDEVEVGDISSFTPADLEEAVAGNNNNNSKAKKNIIYNSSTSTTTITMTGPKDD